MKPTDARPMLLNPRARSIRIDGPAPQWRPTSSSAPAHWSPAFEPPGTVAPGIIAATGGGRESGTLDEQGANGNAASVYSAWVKK
jgi:hypothetical protein